MKRKKESIKRRNRWQLRISSAERVSGLDDEEQCGDLLAIHDPTTCVGHRNGTAERVDVERVRHGSALQQTVTDPVRSQVACVLVAGPHRSHHRSHTGVLRNLKLHQQRNYIQLLFSIQFNFQFIVFFFFKDFFLRVSSFYWIRIH